MTSVVDTLARPTLVSTGRDRRRHRFGVLPGFGLGMGFATLYLALLVLLPLAALVLKAAGFGWTQFVDAAFSPRVLASYRLTFGAALIAAAINGVFGLLTAWVLVRYRFPGRRLLDALIDLPFSLPTAVAGIALTAVYAPNGVMGRLLAPLGIEVAFQPLGVVVALVFIGLPFVTRTVQPVLEVAERELEEAAATLGASRWQAFARVILPALLPALLTGIALAFARGIGEYGSVIFIAGNVPMVSEIAPLLIITKLEQYDYGGATAIAVVMLAMSFVMLLAINALQGWRARREGADDGPSAADEIDPVLTGAVDDAGGASHPAGRRSTGPTAVTR